MNRSKLSVLFVLAVLVTAGCAWDASAATVGETAPAFSLKDLQGNEHSLADYQGKVVVLEWINPNCPFSERHAKEKTMTTLEHQHGDVVWLAINSTNGEHQDFLTPAQHMAYNRRYGIDYPVLYDTSGEVGHAYDAKTTPHMFIIDEEGTLIYEGAIDDDPLGRQKSDERLNYVGVGFTAHGTGDPVEPATTKPYGCSVKY